MKTKIEAMKAMEKAGLGFTANVIMNGCGKPTRKMNVILALLEKGIEVRHAPHETLGLIIGGEFHWLGALDKMSLS